MPLPGFLLAVLTPVQHAPALPEPFWSHALLGSGHGSAGIVVLDQPGGPELVVGGDQENHLFSDSWQALRRRPGIGDWVTSYSSELLPARLCGLATGTPFLGGGVALVVVREDGHVEWREPASKQLIHTFSSGLGAAEAIELADLDGDGDDELLLINTSRLQVHDGSGALLATVFHGGYDLVAAQMDADAALEIAVTSGVVLDSLTWTPQWSWAAGFGSALDAEDLDGDGRAELVAMSSWNLVMSFNVDLGLPWWSISSGASNGCIELADLESDGDWELLLGGSQFAPIRCYDARTTQPLWTLPNPEHGVAGLTTADVDLDGDQELIWAASGGSSAAEYVLIVDWQTGFEQWRSDALDGPMLGPVRGDLDGDQLPELVTASLESRAGRDSGKLLVFDGASHELLAVSAPVAGNQMEFGVRGLALHDVDADGRQEIAIAGDFGGDGWIGILEYAAGVFTEVWSVPPPLADDAPFHSLAIADLDLDGDLEVLGGGSRYSSSSLGTFLVVFDYATRTLEWQSQHLGTFQGHVAAIEVADTDGDGYPEALALLHEQEVHVFDGRTQALEAVLPGEYTAMRVIEAGPRRYVVLGDEAGALTAFVWTGAGYSVALQRTVFADEVEGITAAPAAHLLVGAGGRLNLVSLLTGAIRWQSGDYGTGFGRVVAFGAGSPLTFYSAGMFSVVGHRR